MPLRGQLVTSDKYNAILQKLDAVEREKKRAGKKGRRKRARGEEKERRECSHCAMCRNDTAPGSEAEVGEWVQRELRQLFTSSGSTSLMLQMECVCGISVAALCEGGKAVREKLYIVHQKGFVYN